jgi:hypothetical protein
LDGGAAPEERPAGVALVPLSPAAPRSSGLWWRWSPNAAFVAHLMACARQAPQTRHVRRATTADAQTAYRTRQAPASVAGRRMRQVI